MVEFDIDKIVNKGFDITTPIVITNTDNYRNVKSMKRGNVKFNEDVLILKT